MQSLTKNLRYIAHSFLRTHNMYRSYAPPLEMVMFSRKLPVATDGNEKNSQTCNQAFNLNDITRYHLLLRETPEVEKIFT
ncbi:hypothetical protein TNIN_373751 [Trichonephila inaurata madagascariensis]|uniref:Uncharacterized protein n=1 Tax=Trichonephila inaurata madagascariensis TaxID=2747483 RepID=A0A8X6YJW6_9ARAC|nr:hypothetical protein TNIN_373751 [Trichonephila inaurata madagascariensis]